MIDTFIHQNTEWVIVVALILNWLFNGVVHSLPAPDEKSGQGYKFFYNLMHWLANNKPEIARLRINK